MAAGGIGLAQLDTYTDDSRVYTEVATARPLTADILTQHLVATATLEWACRSATSWNVDQRPEPPARILEYSGAGKPNVTITPLQVNTVFEGELFPPNSSTTAYRNGSGMAVICVNRRVEWGTLDPAGGIDTKTPSSGSARPLGTGRPRCLQAAICRATSSSSRGR